MITAKLLLVYLLQSANIVGLDIDTSKIDQNRHIAWLKTFTMSPVMRTFEDNLQ